MRTIMVMNSKGGSGKTTLVTNLAGYYASNNINTVVKDFDPQGSTTDWLKQRAYGLPKIHGLTAFKSASMQVTRAWAMRLPTHTERLIIDSPAGIDLKHFVSTVRAVDKILVPVSPSPIDIRATAMFIHELKNFLKLYPCKAEVGVVANRSDVNSSAYRGLVALFNNLDLHFVATLSQNENYIKAAEHGVSLLELNHPMVENDKQEWKPLIDWVENESSYAISPVQQYRVASQVRGY